ncbi:MAG: cupin domain-containing protein [Deltaproteobacteria bacterium]
MLKGNIYKEAEILKGQEFFETLFSGKNVKIERIISLDHSTPEEELYDQTWDEWVVVVSGNAILRFVDTGEDIHLKTGDFVFIPAHSKHKVVYTDRDKVTIWLAVHLFNH